MTEMTAIDLKALDAACRLRFDIFYQRCFAMLNPAANFQDNWSIDAMAAFAEKVIRGEIRRGIVNVPPRHGKSLMFNVALCAFMLGHDPTLRIFVISYAAQLSSEHSTLFRAIIESEWYKRIFPRMKIKRIVDDQVFTTKRGFRRWTSVLGSMTGMGGDVFIVDDPIKPVDCLSQANRNAVNAWFSNTLLPRLDNKEDGIVLVIMQRLHIDDLSGYLQRQTDSWTKLVMSAIAEVPQEFDLGRGRTYKRQPGEVLNPARESRATLDNLRAEMGSPTFSAHYQQRPVPIEGAMLWSEWFQFVDAAPTPDRSSYIIQSWDTAAKQGLLNSYSACVTILVHQGNYYILHVLRKRMTFPQLLEAAEALARRFKPRHILIEDASSGTGLAQILKRKFPLAVRTIKPEHDKVVRLFLQQPKFEQRRVHFLTNQPWLSTLLEELLSFPESPYSDQVDAISQALAFQPYDGNSAENIAGYRSFLTELALRL